MNKREKIDLLHAMHIVMLSCNDTTCYEDWVSTAIQYDPYEDDPYEDGFELIAKDKEKFRYVVDRFCKLVNDFF